MPDQKANKTTTYTYTNGNITECNEYEYTTGALGAVLDTKTWQYGDSTWSDLLTNFNGQQITYDEIGNPLTIGNKTLSWDGRQLRHVVDGNSTYAYQYNADGQRISKTVNGLKTEFVYNGSILAGQKCGNDTIIFMYDNNGDTFGFTYNATDYFYIKNAQNDVTAIADTTGAIVVNYNYDAWGKINSITGSLASTIGELNPIRYRSYFYDSEINMYYLNSRYYSPDLCRFLNADGIIGANKDIHAYNLFTYCSNNPVNYSDSTGCSIGSVLLAAIGAAAPWILAITAVVVVGCIIATVISQPAVSDGISTGIGNAIDDVNDGLSRTKEKWNNRTKSKDRTRDLAPAIPKEKNKNNPVIFPLNPLEFNPIGLEPISRHGTKNGSFISWVDPVTNKEVFRWDENLNYSNGAHYHINGMEEHYYAGMEVPEPYASIYFPQR